MDEKDRRRITRNLTALKERVGADLDHIVDKLIERDIFDIWIKDDIDNVLPPTPQRKADILLRKLIGSGKQAYPAFRDTLLERGGYDDLVYLMEPTKPEIQFSMNMAVSNDRKSESSSSNQEESELTSRKIESMDVEDEMLNKPSQHLSLHGDVLMDEKDRRRITRNLTALKERVGADLDHIVDKLIERDIFDIWIKDDIDNVLPPTPQRKADILLRKLIGSGKQAYPAFRDTLLERGGYDDLVYLMEPTKPEIQFSMNMAVSNDRKSESSSSNQEESELTSRKIESMDVEDEMLNKPSQVDTADYSSAMVSKEMLTAMMTKVDKLDERVDEKVQEMSEEVKVLKDALTKLSEERVSLLEKINDLHEKVAASNKENLKKKYKNKKNEMKALRKRNIELEKENIKYIKEMKTLRAQVIRKDQEIEVLKKRVSRIENEPNKQAQTTESNCKDASAKFKLREWLSNLKMKVLFPPKFSKK